MEHDPEHRFDVFYVGQEVPYGNGVVEITDRELTDELPDDIPDWADSESYWPPEKHDDVPFVIIEWETQSGERPRLPACRFAHDVGVSFSEHGLPRVRGSAVELAHKEATISASTPGTGFNSLSRVQARELAGFIRASAGFEPLYALLGGVETEDDMMALADALERAAAVREIGEQIETLSEQLEE